MKKRKTKRKPKSTEYTRLIGWLATINGKLQRIVELLEEQGDRDSYL